MDYSQINAPSNASAKRVPGLTVDKTCKLLKSAEPLVWAVAIVFGLLGVTLIVRYLWRRNQTRTQEPSASGDGIVTLVHSSF